jgi:hypothetical protein
MKPFRLGAAGFSDCPCLRGAFPLRILIAIGEQTFVAQATRTKRLFTPNFCATLCQFCAVEFLEADENPSRNAANRLVNNGLFLEGLVAARKE